MIKDTRDRNKYFNNSSLKTYFEEYSESINVALRTVSTEQLDRAYEEIRVATGYAGERLFVGGNGGSAAISDHLTCDFTKGVKKEKSFAINVISLCASHALHTAIANDMGYEKTLSYQLELYNFNYRDTLILISSSGNSPNIIQAARYAKSVAAPVIALTGFDGGELNRIADIKLHIDANNYGIVEDCHQILMHTLAQYIYLNE